MNIYKYIKIGNYIYKTLAFNDQSVWYTSHDAWYSLHKTGPIKRECVIASSDNPADLCDAFIIVDKSKQTEPFNIQVVEQFIVTQDILDLIANNTLEVYGAVYAKDSVTNSISISSRLKLLSTGAFEEICEAFNNDLK